MKKVPVPSTKNRIIHYNSASPKLPLPKEAKFTYAPKQISVAQRTFLASASSILAFLNPHRGDMVATLGDTTAEPFFVSNLMGKMKESLEGQYILKKKPLVNTSTIDLQALQKLPPETFGYEYAKFMSNYSYSPDERTPVRFVNDPEVAYTLQRYREVHDFVHVLLGLPTTVLAEVSQKWFEMLQTQLPVCFISSIFGPFRLTFEENKILVSEIIPWAVKCNQRADFLFEKYFESYFYHNIHNLRKRWGIILPPPSVFYVPPNDP